MTNARLEELRVKFQENPRRYFAPFANELRKTGDPAQAIEVCRNQLASQPGHVSGHIVLGQALYEAGEPDEARDVFSAALELDPENLIALRTLGEIAQVNGDFAAARQWYERLLDADPRNAEVAQLLRDIPTEAPAPPIPAAPEAPLEEPTPFTVRADYEPPATEPPEPTATPAPTFHTSFTGSQRAYDPDVEPKALETLPQEEPVQAAATDEPDEPFIDLEPSAHDEGADLEVGEPVVAATTSEAMEMVDVDSFPLASSEGPQDEEPPSGELLEFDQLAETEPTEAGSIEPAVAGEATDSRTDTGGAPIAGVDLPELGEVVSPEPTTEHPRAVFAERGFDGPANDETGWMTTPSAAFSDLEAAPETWLDEPASVDSQDVTAEPNAIEEPSVAEQGSAPDYANESWFDEIPGAATIESTEITPSELWLPPEIPEVTQAEDNTNRDTGGEAEAASVAESHELHEPDWLSPVPTERAESESPIELETTVTEPVAEQAEVPAADDSEPSWQPAAETQPPNDEEARSHAEPEEPEEVAWAAASAEPDLDEPPRFDVEALADAGYEASIVEQPATSSLAEARSQEERAVPDEDRASEAMSLADATAASDAAPPSTAGGSSETEPYASEVVTDEIPVVGDSVIGRSPAFAEQLSTPAPAPFITETLAELYLRQGFRDEALSIYRQLSERDPDNASLKNRIAAIEQPEARAVRAGGVETETRVASQSVRTFFSRIARRPAVRGEGAAPPAAGAPPRELDADLPFTTAASALSNLFSASRPAPSDEGAASTLAGAFTDPAGRPSRAPGQELSLDHLFRDVPGGGAPGGGVTLDEFYSTPDAETGSPTEPSEARGSEESAGADIRQFTAWLEGLRKK